MLEKKAITSLPIDELIARRWSLRAFDPGKAVTREQIIRICEAARWAPSCSGDEPWRFIVWDKHLDFSSWERAFKTLSEWNRKWVVNAPVLIAAFADSKFRKGYENRWGQFDTGAACENLYLQAFSLGLAVHPMGGFDFVALMREFNIPDSFVPMAMIAAGYPAEPDTIPEPYYQQEIQERKRRALGENFFFSAWNSPIIEE